MAQATPLLTYSELVARYGSTVAFDLLLTIEKAAKVRVDNTCIDEEMRLKRALDYLDSKVLGV